jgi:hypothetical protein
MMSARCHPSQELGGAFVTNRLRSSRCIKTFTANQLCLTYEEKTAYQSRSKIAACIKNFTCEARNGA